MALDISKRILGTVDGGANFATYRFPVANGVTVTAGDFVYFSSGRLSSATITGDARPVGMVLETQTGNSGGTITALVNIDDDSRYLLQQDNIGTTFAASHVGQYFDLIGATGAQLVDTSTVSTTTGILICLEYNPAIDPVASDLTYGVFMLVESATDPLGS